jgi:hypothetical protein
MITARAGAVDRRLWFDTGLACLVPAVQLALLIFTGALQPWTAADAVTISLVLVQGVPLAARRATTSGSRLRSTASPSSARRGPHCSGTRWSWPR